MNRPISYVPYSDLISNHIVNWTLGNYPVRTSVMVGVAYGSDVQLIMKTLIDSTEGQSLVVVNPAPQVMFQSFGASSLDFELRVWVSDAKERPNIISDLHQEIDRRFREANIEIAFPQQDIRIRSVDQPIPVNPAKAAEV